MSSASVPNDFHANKGVLGKTGPKDLDAGSPDLIQSLVRADAILSAIAESGPGGATLNDIATITALNKSTAHHLLKTLVSLGFVEQLQASRRYQIGLRSFRLIWQSQRLRELSREYHGIMMRLCHRSGETVNLSVPHGNGALVISSLEGQGMMRASTYTGALWALHATACGKVMLAQLPLAQLRAYLATPKRRFTTNTITDGDALWREIETVAKQGYAIEAEEHEVGAACVGAPVLDCDNRFSAVISIAAPVSRMGEARLRDIAAMVTSEVASANLGSPREQLHSIRAHRKNHSGEPREGE